MGRISRSTEVLAIGALAFAASLAGVAFAGSPRKAVTKSKVVKIADQEIDKRAANLSVAQAASAADATNATNLGGSPATAYAKGAIEAVHHVGASGQPAFDGSWENELNSFATAGFYKDGFGIVHLVGDVRAGTDGSTIFTLPSGYRPAAGVDFASRANSDTGTATVVVEDGGAVKAFGYTVTSNRLSLNGVAFRTR